jgi:2-keto-4-pentenoate hydratase
VAGIDPRLARALTLQLRSWRALLEAGHERVGWKLGMGDRESIGGGPVVGHLTSATQLEPGATFRPDGVAALHADAEVALELGRDVERGADRETAQAAIAGYGVALELVDLGPTPGGAESIVAGNVFHRAFALGRMSATWPADAPSGRLVVNGRSRGCAPAAEDYGELVRSVAELLGAVGERLREGDRLITGSIVQVALEPGDDVVAELGELGRVGMRITP